MKKLLIVAAGMVVVAAVGGIVGRDGTFGARRAEGLAACMSTETRNGLRDALLTRVAARGGDVDGGYAVTLDEPRLESVDDAAMRTVCGGTARLAVPEHRRVAMDGVSELSDSVRYVIEPSRTGPGMVVALIGGGDVMMNWLGGPPPPPPAPPADLLRADYAPEAETADAFDAEPVVAPEIALEPDRAAAPAPRATPAPAQRAPAPRPTARPAPAPTPRAPPRVTAPRVTTPPPAPRVTAPPRRPMTPTPIIATTPRVTPPVVRARPSFDCGQARNPAEHTICSDQTLADLDVTMARRYARMQNNVDEKMAAILRDEQRAWLRRRDACSTRACLLSLYQARTATMGYSG